MGTEKVTVQSKETAHLLLQPTSRNVRKHDLRLNRATKLHLLILSIQDYLKMILFVCVSLAT